MISGIAQKRPYATIAAEESEPPKDRAPEPMSLQDKRLVTGIFKKLWNCPFATPFLQPVDPVYFNIPDYFDIIKHPMDLSTIQKKLDDYHSKEEFIADVELMLNNCYLYNNPTDPVCDTAREFEKVFKKQLIKLRATPPAEKKTPEERTDISEEEHKHVGSVIKEFKKPKHAHLTWPFERPVDAAAWGAADYYDIIKQPMDMATIEEKWKQSKYANEDEFYNDYKLIFENCYKYNPPLHEVHLLGKKFEAAFDKYWSKIHGGSNAVKKPHVEQNVNITPPSIKNETPINHDTNIVNNNTSQTNSSTANDGRNVLRIKLNIKKPATEEAKPPPSKPVVKIPGLALSKDPPPSSTPKLALDHQPPPPQLEKKEQRPPIVLQNQDKWLAQAKQRAFEQQQSNKVNDARPLSESPKTPVFDIGELYNKINDEKKARQQQLREERERREREERVRRERERKRYEEQMAKRREFREKMMKKREKDSNQRIQALNKRVVDISAQKMSSHTFELNVLCKDLDWRELNSWQRETVDYRHIPVPAFVRRSHINLQELRSKLLSKSVRLKNASKQAQSTEQITNQDSDMEVE